MAIEWDERFDILIGADIRDSEAEPYLDSGVHDLLHGEETEHDEISSLLLSADAGLVKKNCPGKIISRDSNSATVLPVHLLYDCASEGKT